MDKATPASVDSAMALFAAANVVHVRFCHQPNNENLTAFESACAAFRAEVERLAAQAAPTERDAQDAARYRWLRDGELTADYPYPVMRMGGSRVDDQTIWNDELDAAIDAAMAKD